MKIITKADTSIPLSEMKDGDIAKIISWGGGDGLYRGEVVQRYREFLIAVGKPSGGGWGKIFPNSWEGNYRVEILRKGTILEID